MSEGESKDLNQLFVPPGVQKSEPFLPPAFPTTNVKKADKQTEVAFGVPEEDKEAEKEKERLAKEEEKKAKKEAADLEFKETHTRLHQELADLLGDRQESDLKLSDPYWSKLEQLRQHVHSGK